MSNRVIDLTTDEGKLRVHLDRLVLDRAGERLLAIPVNEVAVLIVSSRSLVVTPSVLSTMAQHGASVLVCDRAYRPQAQVLPLDSHHLQAERLRLQVEASKPLRKQIWKQLVQAKIIAQAEALEALGKKAGRLRGLVRRVRSGDPENVEAQASRWYWPRLFNDPSFRRRRDGGGANVFLNYAYAVVRGAVARAVCGAGLHPSISVHHTNRYNPFCLVDDLMEPLRPIVDLTVATLPREALESGELSQAMKRHLVESVTGPCVFAGEERALFGAALRMATSLVDVFRGDSKKILVPKMKP